MILKSVAYININLYFIKHGNIPSPSPPFLNIHILSRVTGKNVWLQISLHGFRGISNTKALKDMQLITTTYFIWKIAALLNQPWTRNFKRTATILVHVCFSSNEHYARLKCNLWSRKWRLKKKASWVYRKWSKTKCYCFQGLQNRSWSRNLDWSK